MPTLANLAFLVLGMGMGALIVLMWQARSGRLV
jgi:hypothetical protein